MRHPRHPTLRVVRDMFWLGFERDVTRERRQQILDSVDGVAVGGMSLGDQYLIQLAPETTIETLEAAIRAVARQSGVKRAAMDIIFDSPQVHFLRPGDGSNYAGWSIEPKSAAGNNWATEAVAAPLAWGCETGGSNGRIGVIDEGFWDINDLHPNLAAGSDFDHTPIHGGHGTQVAAIAAARGNNDTGMTGMAWHATVRTYYMRDSVPGYAARFWPFMHMVQAGVDGYPIINMSFGRYGTPYDTLQIWLYAEAVRWGYSSWSFEPNPPRPLLVMAAGNDGVDAFASGLAAGLLDSSTTPTINADRAAHTLVVTANRRDSSSNSMLPSFANRGNLANVAAPGDSVWTLDSGGVLVPKSGTSYAAPHVSGLAALLLSHDPTLTADSLRSLIMAGAIAGGRSVIDPTHSGGSIPIINAYESLKLAARRSGGPICGQRVWANNQNIYVERTPGTTPELLAAIGSPVWDMDAVHGGRRINFKTPSGNEHLAFTGGSWGSSVNWLEPAGGTYASMHGSSHDWDASVYPYFEIVAPDSERVMVEVWDSLSGRLDSVGFQVGPWGPEIGLDPDSFPTTRVVSVAQAFPPTGDSALIAVNRMRATTTDLSFPCMNDLFIWEVCANARYAWIPDTAYLYTISTTAAIPTLNLVRVLPDTIVYWIGLSETGDAAVVAVGAEVDTVERFYESRNVFWCSIRYLNNRIAGAPALSVSSTDACSHAEDNERGAGTISPRTSGGFPLMLKKQSRRPTAIAASPFRVPKSLRVTPLTRRRPF